MNKACVDEKALSKGERALIKALRKSEIEHVWEAKSAVLTAESTYHDFIAFMTAGETTTDNEIREALNKISKEQQEANNE